MSLSMYESSIPALVRHLNILSALLKKGEDHATEKGFDAAVLINARLYPDMFPLVKQVQIACDVSKGAAARLSGGESPKHEDTESSFSELQARISRTLAYVESVPANKIDGSEEREIVLKAGSSEYKFTGKNYLQGFVLPNVYFHITTAYNIMRHNGVILGKMDFLGNVV
ncbi:MAG: DUF1993 domain-containing protein [Gammaproteobacteria bacterium]